MTYFQLRMREKQFNITHVSSEFNFGNTGNSIVFFRQPRAIYNNCCLHPNNELVFYCCIFYRIFGRIYWSFTQWKWFVEWSFHIFFSLPLCLSGTLFLASVARSLNFSLSPSVSISLYLWGKSIFRTNTTPNHSSPFLSCLPSPCFRASHLSSISI